MGAEIVTAAARYHRVRVEASVVLARDVSAAPSSRRSSPRSTNTSIRSKAATSGRLAVRRAAALAGLERCMLEVEGVRGIARLNLVIDGFRLASCADFATPEHELLWPVTHEIVRRHPLRSNVMSCAAGIPRFRLLDGLVGWDEGPRPTARRD
jgi:hypothetical protein